MKIEQLKDYIVVAKRRNITRSAAELHTSQPSLSMRISSIEKEIGCPLFERSNNGLELNESGRVFLDHAQRLVTLYEEGVRKARLARGVETVRIAVDLSTDLARALPSSAEMPFRIIELDINSPAVDAVALGQIDLAVESDYSCIPVLCDEASRLGITYLPVGQGSNFLAMMRSHPLAEKSELRRADLDGQTVVVNSGMHLDRWSKAIQHIIGPEIRLKFRLNQVGSYGDAALADFGDAIYICGSSSSRPVLERREDVVVFDALDGRPIMFPTALVCRAADLEDDGGAVGRFARAFVDGTARVGKTS
ncbi:MAG: LysR family transcriptional regulator [Coriobacteriia bacterium]|nr:LysR family transcriptional regulator [Coriobacteriia bacterium]